VLTSATCEANLQCNLQYGKKCSDNVGYWSDNEAHLDYPGCEYWCNLMNTEADGKITSCELGQVTSDVRVSKGLMCFAHTKACVLSDLDQNAAAVCEKYGGEGGNEQLSAGLAQKGGAKHHRRLHKQ
jgi:hypothetical protein